MSQFGGGSCVGGVGQCIDYEHGNQYTSTSVSQSGLEEGLSPFSGGSVHFPDLDVHASTSSNLVYSNDPKTYHQPQYRMYTDQAYSSPSTVSAPSASVGVLASTADGENQCQCEYLMFDNFKWVKKRHYVVAKDGHEYLERYVVTYRLPNSNVQYDMFTHTEGLVRNVPIENKFSHLCGEVVALHRLPPVNSLTNVCYYKPPSVDPTAPFHVQEEVCKTNSLTAVPLVIDTSHQVLVVRTYNDNLALQLMPTTFSERPILPGTPLFHGIRRTICGTVGNMFSEFYYVINGAPCIYTLFSIGTKEKSDSSEGDRLRVVILDRRDRVDSEEWSANESVLNSVSDITTPTLQRIEGKQARLDVRDILYVGVVNSNLQLTDAPNISKKYKPPKSAVVIVIDNRGVHAVYIKDKEIVGQWVQKDANVTYSILPGHFFDKPRSSIVRINTADTNAKLKRSKSREILI